MLHQCEVDVRDLEDVVVEVALEDAETSTLSDNVSSCFEIDFPGSVVEFKAD